MRLRTVLGVLVVDDEPLILRSILRSLASRTDVQVIGECDSGNQAISLIRDLRPDLVLLDVQMPHGSGLEVVEQIGPEQMPAVIFVTAYDEYAVKAFEWNAVDYLLKPFDEERLFQSLERAKHRLGDGCLRAWGEQLRALLESRNQRWPERIVVKTEDRFDLLKVDTIDWVESANNYVQIHCGRQTHLMAGTLAGLSERLDPTRFVRIHRGRVVNFTSVVTAHSLPGGTFELALKDGTRLTTGRQYRDHVQSFLQV